MSPTFEEMYQHFCTNASNEELGERLGVTTQTLSTLCQTVFAGLPGCKSADERERERDKAIREETFALAEIALLTSDPLCHIVKSANEHGCHVSAIPSGDKPGEVYARRILVNQKPCHVYYVNQATVIPGGKRPYGRAEFKLSMIRDAWRVITYLRPPGYDPKLIVVPPQVVFDAYAVGVGQCVKVHIPLGPSDEAYKNHKQRVPWEKYEDRWPGHDKHAR